MKIQFSEKAWEDCTYWQQSDKGILKKIHALIQDISRNDPYSGVGKPERLKYAFSGFWSRRITDEYRIVYRVFEGVLQIVQLRYHY